MSLLHHLADVTEITKKEREILFNKTCLEGGYGAFERFSSPETSVLDFVKKVEPSTTMTEMVPLLLSPT